MPKWDIYTTIFEYNFIGVLKIFRLKELRKTRKISQTKLVMDLNMSQNNISRYETERRQADYETLIAFGDYFNVSVDFLLGRTDNPEFNNLTLKGELQQKTIKIKV